MFRFVLAMLCAVAVALICGDAQATGGRQGGLAQRREIRQDARVVKQNLRQQQQVNRLKAELLRQQLRQQQNFYHSQQLRQNFNGIHYGDQLQLRLRVEGYGVPLRQNLSGGHCDLNQNLIGGGDCSLQLRQNVGGY